MKGYFISFFDKQEEIFLQKKLTGLPLNEDVIIAKSIEYYNDSNPCMIHRSAIMKLMYIQIENVLNEKFAQGKQKFFWTELPDFVREYLKVDQETYYVMLQLF